MEPSDQTPPEKKPGIGSRILLAAAFSSVGAKLGFLGTPADANAAFAGETMTLGQKIKGTFNGSLVRKLHGKIKDLIVHENKNIITAGAKVFKYTTIITVIGMAAGAVVGWMRGARIDDWHDIVRHPITSTKLILGLQEPDSKTPPAVVPAPEPSPEPATQWAASVQQRGSHVEALAQEKSVPAQGMGV